MPEFDFYIFNWPGAVHAQSLEKLLTPLGRLTVINSGNPVQRPNWVNLDASAYFAAQWNAALQRFRGDILFHIQADAYSDDLPLIVERAKELYDRRRWGVFAPEVDYTAHVAKTRQVEPEVWEVPCTDCTCWAIDASVLELGPISFPGKYGWGIDLTYAAISRALVREVLRDYRYQITHPKGTGYSQQQALMECRLLESKVCGQIQALRSGTLQGRIQI